MDGAVATLLVPAMSVYPRDPHEWLRDAVGSCRPTRRHGNTRQLSLADPDTIERPAFPGVIPAATLSIKALFTP